MGGKVMFKAVVITLSDKGSRGEREDLSGQVIKDIVCRMGGSVENYILIPDDAAMLKEKLLLFSSDNNCDLIITTGGTGMGPRDITPETTKEVIEKEIPGMAEAMRMESLKKTPHGMLSRAVCGMRGETLIINLPGSPKAVQECLEVIKPALPHAIQLIKGKTGDCAR